MRQRLGLVSDLSPEATAAFEVARTLLRSVDAGDRAEHDHVVALAERHPEISGKLIAFIRRGEWRKG